MSVGGLRKEPCRWYQSVYLTKGAIAVQGDIEAEHRDDAVATEASKE